MHFLTVVLLPQEVPPDEAPIYDALHHLLAPYYSHLEPEGPMHKEYVDAQTIEKFAALYGVPPANLPEMAAKLRQEWGLDGGVDEHGLYELTNLNPNRKLDRWTLHNVDTDVWPTRNMPRDLLPTAVVTPDGQWHRTGEEWRPGDLTASERQAIGQRAYALIDQYPECQAVALECHA
jgi:hypothetical protein